MSKFTTIVSVKSLYLLPFTLCTGASRVLEGGAVATTHKGASARKFRVTLQFLQDPYPTRIFVLSRLFLFLLCSSLFPLILKKRTHKKRGLSVRHRQSWRKGGRSCFYKRFNIICMFLKHRRGRNGRL